MRSTVRTAVVPLENVAGTPREPGVAWLEATNTMVCADVSPSLRHCLNETTVVSFCPPALGPCARDC